MQTELTTILEKAPPFDDAAAQAAQKRWDSIAKPLGSLGRLETLITRIAGLTGDHRHGLKKRAVLVLCADNGVVRQGVSQVGSEITTVLAQALAAGDLTVCKMAKAAKTDVYGVDMGINGNPDIPGLLDRRIAPGTADMTEGPAMTREQAIAAIRHGIDLVGWCREQGYEMLATGEVGIGNTTTSSAVASVLLDRSPSDVTGRGAGLSSEGMLRKIAAIEKAIAVNKPDPADAIDVLAKLGGFDIAGMAGIFLGGTVHRVPILIDGLISSVAALIAQRIFPASTNAMFATHVSAEPAALWLLEALGLPPLLHAGMHLGEGTGALAVIPVLDMAYVVYDDQVTFDVLSMESYQPLS